jgi:2-dehydropantoate 2-reductase
MKTSPKIAPKVAPKIAIVGIGALGCLLASYFAQAHLPVTLILKNKKRVQAFNEQGGIHLEKNNCTQVFHIPATTAREAKTFNIIFITVKAYDIRPALKALKSCINKQTMIVLMNNGLGVREEIADLGLDAQLVFVSHYLAATKIGPYRIRPGGISPLWLGTFQHQPPTAIHKKLLHLCTQIKLSPTWSTSIENHLWLKFAANCVINPITTLLQCKNGILIQKAPLMPIAARLCDEINKVAMRFKVALTAAELLKHVKTVATQSQENYSSMVQDKRSNRITEINYLNGYVVQQAKRFKIDVPYNELLTTLIQVDCTL